MIHAYNEIYLNTVMHNLAALFDIAINAEEIDADVFAEEFAASSVASGIENGSPDMLSGKSATELLMLIIDKDVKYTVVPMNRTPEYWAGWILAYAQWYLNKTFKEIIHAIPFSRLVAMYYPYHEADEMKTIEIIKDCFPKTTKLKSLRQKVNLTQEQLALISGVNIRSIKAYEQGENDILKAQGETLFMLAKALNCSIEDLLQ